MSISVAGFNSSAIFERISAGLSALPPAEKSATIKKVNGVFHIVIKNAAGAEQAWTLDLKSTGNVSLGTEGKADITINTSDETFGELASGKLNGQKAFMSGKLKVKGNVMLATKLDTVLKAAPAAAAAAPAPPLPLPPPPLPQASPAVFTQIKAGVTSGSPAERKAIADKVKAIFQFDVKNAAGTVSSWSLDLKSGNPDLVTGVSAAKPDIVIAIADQDFVDLAGGKLNPQKAFMGGKIKVKGNVMLATKLDGVFKSLQQSKAKL
ncbi:SCP2 sterol-binding domain-containing protein [Chytridium lagenaria]|nr:SCP2 sterol-binding domain-containing protein [Chytridium lagenaria]